MTNKLALLNALLTATTGEKTFNLDSAKKSTEAARQTHPFTNTPGRPNNIAFAGNRKQRSEVAGKIITDIKDLITQETRKINKQNSEVVKQCSIVTIEKNGKKETLFIAPIMGSEKIDDITVIAPLAPLAQAMLGMTINDTFAFGKTAGHILHIN